MIPFVKAHACGNDFLIVEDGHAAGKHAAVAQRLCARHTGIGADGIEFLDRRLGYRLRLFNSDATEAELSGNGTRCVAAWLAEDEGIETVSFETHGGTRTCRVMEQRDSHYVIEGGMGIPKVMARTIVVPGVGEVPGAMVNVGNPHFVLFVDSAEFDAHGRSWQDLGALISVSPLFPHGTNVEFARVESSSEIAFRIFERGCGPTTSSGTGTCAASAAAITLRGVERELTAKAEGGSQRVAWPSAAGEMLLTGPAEIICTGEALVL